MATLEQTAILFLTDNIDTKPSIFNGFGYRVFEVSIDDTHAVSAVRDSDTHYDVIVFHGIPNADMLDNVQQVHPSTPTLVLLEQVTTLNHHQLMQLDIDDVLTHDLSQREVERRIQWAIKCHTNKRDIEHRRDNLATLTTLLQYMQNQDFFIEIITSLRDLFQLDGVAIFPRDPANITRILKRDAATFVEVPTYLQEFDPFMQVIEMGKSQYYPDIVAHPYYTPLPALPQPSTVIIVPIPGSDPTLGAVAMFASRGTNLTEDDVPLFEMFANQLSIIKPSISVAHSETTQSYPLLPIWQQMIELSSAKEIIDQLHVRASEYNKVQHAIVWIDMLTEEQTLVGNAESVQCFEDLQKSGHLAPIFEKLHNSLEPILLWRSAIQDPIQKKLFKVMESECIVVFPIVDSARLIGLLIVSVRNNRFFDDTDFRAIENLAFASGQAIERKTFTHLMHEESTRLEAILQSISEGTFFVDEHDCVTFCNPQFTELTGINRSRIIEQSSSTLLEHLIRLSDEPDQTRQNLRDALDNLNTVNDYYPIITITSAENDVDIVVEIAAIDVTIDGITTWAGVVRPSTQQAAKTHITNELIGAIAQKMPATYSDVETIIQKMLDSHSRLTPKTTGHFVRKLNNHISQIRLLWDNFLELVRFENGIIRQDKEEIALDKLVDYACDTPHLTHGRDWLSIQRNGQIPSVYVDMLQTTQAISNILTALHEGNGIITLEIDSYDQQACIRITRNAHHPAEWLDASVAPTDIPDQQFVNYFGFRLGTELLKQNGAMITTKHEADGTAIVDILLPMTHVETVVDEPKTEYLDDGLKTEFAPRPAPRGLQTIAILVGRSQLSDRMVELIAANKYDLLICNHAEELLQDITSIRIDLVILDADLPSDDSLQTCQMIRNRTTVPIIMLSDSPSLTRKLKAFELEVDEYIEQPITDLEIMARIDTIFNRLQISDRLSEPIKIGGLYINLARREVLLDGKPLELTRIEYDLLRFLAINLNQVLEHEQLLAKVWGPEYRNEKHYLWVNISRLRKKLEPKKDSPRYIYNRPGIGYMLRVP